MLAAGSVVVHSGIYDLAQHGGLSDGHSCARSPARSLTHSFMYLTSRSGKCICVEDQQPTTHVILTMCKRLYSSCSFASGSCKLWLF